METSLTQRKASLEEKVPDIQKTLSMVQFLRERKVSTTVAVLYVSLTRDLLDSQEGKKAKKDDDDGLDDDLEEEEGEKRPIRTTFELNDTLYAEADLDDTDLVYLWLGVCLFGFWHIYSASKLRILAGQRHAVILNTRGCRTSPIKIENSARQPC